MIRVKEDGFEIDCQSGNVGYSFAFVTSQAGAGHVARHSYSANASGGGHAQTRFRSP